MLSFHIRVCPERHIGGPTDGGTDRQMDNSKIICHWGHKKHNELSFANNLNTEDLPSGKE